MAVASNILNPGLQSIPRPAGISCGIELLQELLLGK